MKALYCIVKLLPIICGVILTVHCYMLTMGYDNEIFKEFFSFGWLLAVVLTILSYKLRLCVFHRLFIWFDFLMDLCIKAQRYDIFTMIDYDVEDAREILFSIGICIQLLLLYRMTNGNGCREK